LYFHETYGYLYKVTITDLDTQQPQQHVCKTNGLWCDMFAMNGNVYAGSFDGTMRMVDIIPDVPNEPRIFYGRVNKDSSGESIWAITCGQWYRLDNIGRDLWPDVYHRLNDMEFAFV
jgi:hypothetical protein